MLQQQGRQQQVEMLSAVKTLLSAAKTNNSTSLAMSSTDASISSTPAVAGTTVYVERERVAAGHNQPQSHQQQQATANNM
jgi:hypothetical protein